MQRRHNVVSEFVLLIALPAHDTSNILGGFTLAQLNIIGSKVESMASQLVEALQGYVQRKTVMRETSVKG